MLEELLIANRIKAGSSKNFVIWLCLCLHILVFLLFLSTFSSIHSEFTESCVLFNSTRPCFISSLFRNTPFLAHSWGCPANSLLLLKKNQVQVEYLNSKEQKTQVKLLKTIKGIEWLMCHVWKISPKTQFLAICLVCHLPCLSTPRLPLASWGWCSFLPASSSLGKGRGVLSQDPGTHTVLHLVFPDWITCQLWTHFLWPKRMNFVISFPEPELSLDGSSVSSTRFC